MGNSVNAVWRSSGRKPALDTVFSLALIGGEHWGEEISNRWPDAPSSHPDLPSPIFQLLFSPPVTPHPLDRIAPCNTARPHLAQPMPLFSPVGAYPVSQTPSFNPVGACPPGQMPSDSPADHHPAKPMPPTVLSGPVCLTRCHSTALKTRNLRKLTPFQPIHP